MGERKIGMGERGVANERVNENELTMITSKKNLISILQKKTSILERRRDRNIRSRRKKLHDHSSIIFRLHVLRK